MENISIFAVSLYLIITNPFIKLRTLDDGLTIIIRWKKFNLTAGKYREDVIVKFIKLIKFKHNKTL